MINLKRSNMSRSKTMASFEPIAFQVARLNAGVDFQVLTHEEYIGARLIHLCGCNAAGGKINFWCSTQS